MGPPLGSRLRAAFAARRPLGAYYRVNHRDLVAMHAAMTETGILYVSSNVHDGWYDIGKTGEISRLDLRGCDWRSTLNWLVFPRPLQRSKFRQCGSDRGGYSDSAEIDRGAAIRKPEQRQRERLFG